MPNFETPPQRRRLPFPLLCIGCGVLVVVAFLLILWLLHAIQRAQKSQKQHNDHVCQLAQQVIRVLDSPHRTAASILTARSAANEAVRDMQRFRVDPTQCQLLPPRTNDLFALQQEALAARVPHVAAQAPQARVRAETGGAHASSSAVAH